MHEMNVSGDDVESRLFRTWLKDGKVDSAYFSDDGIVSDENFDYWTPRIVFVLKEVHAGKGFSLRSFLSAGAYNESGYKDGSFTWAPVQRWLVALGRAIGCTEIQTGQKYRQAALKTISAINLKKTPGGAVNNYHEMLVWVKNHRDMIQEQISSYYSKPTVFVCCGEAVYRLFTESMGVAGDSPIEISGIKFKKLHENVYVFNVGHHPNKSKRKVHDVRFVNAILAIRKHITESNEVVKDDGKVL